MASRLIHVAAGRDAAADLAPYGAGTASPLRERTLASRGPEDRTRFRAARRAALLRERESRRYGLRRLRPAVSLSCTLALAAAALVTTNPVQSAVILVIVVTTLAASRVLRAAWPYIRVSLYIAAVVLLVNPLFVGAGLDVLWGIGVGPFRIAVTVQGVVFGVGSALRLAGVILAFVMTLELIQLITDRNNMHDMDTWMFFKWIFKTACAVLIVTNTWNIVMGVFDVAQSVISNASGVVVGNINIDIASHFADLEARLMEMGIGELLGLWLQSFIVGISMWFLSICIFLIAYGRMIEIYLVTSVAPIPMATMANREWGQMGTNYLRSLFALGFQGFLIIVCVAIYAVLVQNMIVDTNIATAIWSCMGYTVLLCFTLFKTGSLAKSVFNAH